MPHMSRETSKPVIICDETWRGEAEVEEPPVVAGLAGEAASPLATSSHCGVFQPQDETGQQELAVGNPKVQGLTGMSHCTY